MPNIFLIVSLTAAIPIHVFSPRRTVLCSCLQVRNPPSLGNSPLALLVSKAWVPLLTSLLLSSERRYATVKDDLLNAASSLSTREDLLTEMCTPCRHEVLSALFSSSFSCLNEELTCRLPNTLVSSLTYALLVFYSTSDS